MVAEDEVGEGHIEDEGVHGMSGGEAVGGFVD